MEIPTSARSSRLSLLISLLILSSALSVTGASAAPRQTKTVVRKTDVGAVVRSYNEIPEATEPCTPEERDWWERVRGVGNDLQKNDGEKLRKRFYLLLYEGQQRGYRIPVKNRPPQVLVFTRPAYITIARERRIKGNVVLSVEYMADGSVGDVRLINGVDSLIDKYVIQTRRQDVFLPAIEEGAFVSHRVNVQDKFNMRN